MYADYDEMDDLENAEDLEPEEVQELLEEEPKTEEKEATEENSELDSQKRSGVTFGSASDNVSYYSDALERNINSSRPSQYWKDQDSYELEKAIIEAEKEKR